MYSSSSPMAGCGILRLSSHLSMAFPIIATTYIALPQSNSTDTDQRTLISQGLARNVGVYVSNSNLCDTLGSSWTVI